MRYTLITATMMVALSTSAFAQLDEPLEFELNGVFGPGSPEITTPWVPGGTTSAHVYQLEFGADNNTARAAPPGLDLDPLVWPLAHELNSCSTGQNILDAGPGINRIIEITYGVTSISGAPSPIMNPPPNDPNVGNNVYRCTLGLNPPPYWFAGEFGTPLAEIAGICSDATDDVFPLYFTLTPSAAFARGFNPGDVLCVDSPGAGITVVATSSEIFGGVPGLPLGWQSTIAIDGLAMVGDGFEFGFSVAPGIPSLHPATIWRAQRAPGSTQWVIGEYQHHGVLRLSNQDDVDQLKINDPVEQPLGTYHHPVNGIVPVNPGMDPTKYRSYCPMLINGSAGGSGFAYHATPGSLITLSHENWSTMGPGYTMIFWGIVVHIEAGLFTSPTALPFSPDRMSIPVPEFVAPFPVGTTVWAMNTFVPPIPGTSPTFFPSQMMDGGSLPVTLPPVPLPDVYFESVAAFLDGGGALTVRHGNHITLRTN